MPVDVPDDLNDLTDLTRRSLRQALERSEGDFAAVLHAFEWTALAEADEALAFTALFEDLGALPFGSDALDVVSAAFLSVDGPACLVWPAGFAEPQAPGPPDRLSVDGVALRSVHGARRTILVPADARVHVLDPEEIEEERLAGMAADSGWLRVRGHGTRGADVGSWSALARRARLAIASELVAVTQRILDVAVQQVSTRRQFGRPIGANQSVRFRLAEGFAEIAGTRALIAAAWEDGTPDASVWAKTVAGATHDSVAKHALQVCGAIGLSAEHPLPGLVRRGFSLDALLGGETEQSSPGAPRHPQPVGTY